MKDQLEESKIPKMHLSPCFPSIDSCLSELFVAGFLVKAGIVIETGQTIQFYFQVTSG